MSNIEIQNDVIEDNHLDFDKLKSNDTSNVGNKILDINYNKKYEIKGKIFNETKFEDDDKYIRFEIRDTNMAEDDASMSMDQNESSSSTPLSLGIQKVPNGVIINSNVYLSDRNYNTIVSVDGRGYCGVCDTNFDIDYQDHINSEKHLENLKSHVPLCKYDLCIIRKLRENYHCGVCNKIFDIKKSNEHFASKNHEDKLLFAVNRVSDIMYDLDIYRKNIDTYHFNAKTINNDNCENDFGGFYDSYKTYEDFQSSDESISDIDEIPNPFSYASMAKKPQITPKFIKIDIGGKKMNVRYDSWHMILSLKTNKYYCMVCKSDGHISLKFDHCVNEVHLTKLKKCFIVQKYVGFLIRKVDNRLFHCAHCNNLRLILDIEDHLKRHKTKKINNITDEYTLTKRNQLRKNENDIENNEKMLKNTDFFIEKEVKELNIFRAKFKISLLSYNMVIFDNNYCCVCDKNIENVKNHIIEVSHIEKLYTCPFLFVYNCNLIRLIKNGYHCAICNVIVQYELIDHHIIDGDHVKILNKIIILTPDTKLTKNTQNTSKNHIDSHKKITHIMDEDYENSLNNIPKVNQTEKEEKYMAEKEEKSIQIKKNKTDIKEKNEHLIEHDENEDSFEDTFLNIEEFVFLKRKNVYAKVTLASLNTLIPTGDGNKFCVLCSTNIDFDKLKKHIENRQHIDNMRKFKYLDKYDKHLFRQIFHTYHCSVCNVMFSYKEINNHMSWSIHRQELEKCHKIVKNNRKISVKNGAKEITIDLQKEILYTTCIEPKIKIGIYYEFSKNNEQICKKSKIIINNDRVLKINWDSWNGFSKTKTGLKCYLCQKEFKNYEQSNHLKNGVHLKRIEDKFLNEFNPAIIRKINNNLLHCVTCNVEIPYKTNIVTGHIKGKKHEKIYETLLKNGAECNYTDCTDDIFILQ